MQLSILSECSFRESLSPRSTSRVLFEQPMESPETEYFLRSILTNLEDALPDWMCPPLISVPGVLKFTNRELAVVNPLLHSHMMQAIQAEQQDLLERLGTL